MKKSAVADVCSPTLPNTSRRITPFMRRVYWATRRIPRGRVSTYKLIASALRTPNGSRAVGTALHHNPWAPHVPCHRVISSDGSIGGFAGATASTHPNIKRKIDMLKKEGVAFNGKGRVEEMYIVAPPNIPININGDELSDEVLEKPEVSGAGK